MYRDDDLSEAGEIYVAITNPNPLGSYVDGYLTDVVNMYSGNPDLPLCTIYMGPVVPRTVSAKRNVASAVSVSFDMGLWSTECRWNPIAP